MPSRGSTLTALSTLTAVTLSWLLACGGSEGREAVGDAGSGGASDGGPAGVSGMAMAGTGDVGGSEGGSAGGGEGGSAGGESAAGGEASVGVATEPCAESEPIALSHGSGRSSQTRAVWTGDGFAVVWTDDRDGNSEIYFAQVDASGQQLAPDFRLTSDPAESSGPSLAWTGSELGLSWTDARDGNTEIYFTVLDRSGQRKANGLSNLRITSAPKRSEFSRLIWTGQEYALTWTDTRDDDFDVYFAKLTRAGTKTTSDIHVARGSSSDIAAGASGFGLVWHSTRDAFGLQIYFARLDEAGAVLGQDLLLSDPQQHGGNPGIAFDGASFGVAWQGNPGTGGEIQWVMLDGAGTLSSPAVPLSQTNGTVGAPSLLPQPEGGFGLSWMDARSGDSAVRFLEVDAAGELQGAEVDVTEDDSSSTAPALVMTEEGYAAAWVDAVSDVSSEVRFRKFCEP